MDYLAENKNELTKKAKHNLSKSWGGNPLIRGGGWSGAFLTLFEILEDIGVFIKI